MSQQIISIDWMDVRNENILVQYKCSTCECIFHSEQLCDEHISNCLQSASVASDQLETSHDRAPKRKLHHSIVIVKADPTSLFDDSTTSDDISDNECKYKKARESSYVDLKQEEYGTLENPTYEATSHMLSENEMLITLPYDQINDSTEGSLDFSNEVAIGFEQHTQAVDDFEQEHKPTTYNKAEGKNTAVIQNYHVDDFSHVDRDSTVKILSVFTNKSLQVEYEAKTKDSEAKNITDTELGSSKTLTVLNTVDVNKISTIHEKEVTVMDILGRKEGSCESKREVYINGSKEESRGKKNVKNSKPIDEEIKGNKEDMDSMPDSQTDSFSIQATKNISNEKAKREPQSTQRGRNKVTYTRINQTASNKKPKKIVQNDTSKAKRKRTLLQESQRKKNRSEQNRRPQSCNKTKKPKNSDDFEGKKDLLYSYKEITNVKEEQDSDKMPNKFAVYEFYDEDDEKLKAKLKEDLEKEKAIKKRTCRHCNEIFQDPMDVLRHKRALHKFERIYMTKEELQPYMDHENKSECPLCLKFLSPKGYNSIYVKHLMTHCDEYNFVCKICHLQFRRKDHWYNHESRHLVRPTVARKN